MRNASDPQINGQTHPTDPGHVCSASAVWYYTTYGKTTSTNSAYTCWAIIADH